MESWFFSENGFAIWCFVRQDDDGRWTAWATFELLSDFVAIKPLIRGVRYRIKKRFATREKAVAACAEMALERARTGEVVIG